MTSPRARIFALAVAGALAGCGGGGGVSASLPAPVVASSAPTSAPLVMTSAHFTITVPAATTSAAGARKPAYISPSTQSVIITLVSVNGVPFTGSPASVASNLTTSNPNCSGTPLTCSVSAPAVAGNDVFSVATYDTQQTSATPGTPAGNVLSKASLSVTVLANQVTTVTTPLTLGGVADHVDVGLGTPTNNAGTPVTVPVSVNVRDKSNNIIVGAGNYVDANGNPLTIQITDSDASGDTSIAPTAITAPTPVTLTYNGTYPNTATLAASIGVQVTGGAIAGTLTPATYTIVVQPPTVTQMSYSEWVTSDAPSSYTQYFSGTNFTPTTTVQIGGAGVAASNVVVTNSTSMSATISVAPGAAATARGITVTNVGGTSAVQPYSLEDGSIVTLNTDTNSVLGGVNGNGNGNPGDLRWTFGQSFNNSLIVFNCGNPCTITLGGPLPPTNFTNFTVDGGEFGNTIIDGAGAYRAFFVDSGTVTLENLQIQNVFAGGGNGGGDGGGGGLGAGAGLVVNQPTANVTLTNVYFLNASVTGGNGGSQTGAGSGGGGGMGADGSAAGGAAGGGGGGVLQAGAFGTLGAGGAGGGAGFGGSAAVGATGGLGANNYAANNNGGSGANSGVKAGDGGPAGFGGGGGAGGDGITPNLAGGAGGTGGFGGGGGGGGTGGAGGSGCGGQGGNGGAGGGGGGGGMAGGCGAGGAAGFGGNLGGTVTGGSGGQFGSNFPGTAGGGGAAAGPAVLVIAGMLTTVNSGASGMQATAGLGGSSLNSGPLFNGVNGTSDATAVFNSGGIVNGTAIGGPVASALSGTAPASILRRAAGTKAARRK